jgi:methionine synthase II (cobalamin-independent)
MKHSTDRILTTRAGSLRRPTDPLALVERDGARAFDAPATAGQLRSAVADIVQTQVDLGIDVVADDEYGKPSFVSNINERLGGPGRSPTRGTPSASATSTISSFYRNIANDAGTIKSRVNRARTQLAELLGIGRKEQAAVALPLGKATAIVEAPVGRLQ